MIKDSLGVPVPESAVVIRATELQTFLNCPRQWLILSHNGLNMEPAASRPKMRLGTIWHKAMEYYYSPEVLDSERWDAGRKGLEVGIEEDHKKLIVELGDGVYTPEFVESSAKDKELLTALYDGYPEWANNNATPSDRTLTPITTEQRFLVPIKTIRGYKSRAYIAVKVDALVRDSTGALWVMEHKTRGVSSRVDDPQGIILDLQMGLQVLALRRYLSEVAPNETLNGVIYNLTRRQKPSSRVRAPIYGRHQVFRSATDLDILESRLYFAYRDMRRVIRNGILHARYNPQVWAGGYCTWGCPAINICEALTRGDDYEYLLDVEFRKRGKDIWQMLEEELSE